MNRVLVGTMLQVAAGERTVASFEALLRGAHRREAGPTAPPHGLALAAVSYERRASTAHEPRNDTA
jgi:tRNA pseudouridine38-40 synthase